MTRATGNCTGPVRLAGMSVEEVMILLGFSMCGSAVFAAMVGTVRGGITIARGTDESLQHETSN